MPVASERRAVYRRTEDIYRKAIEDIRDYAIFMTNPEGVVTNCNTGAEHMLGYTDEEIIGKDAAKLFTAEDKAKGVPEKELATAAMLGRAEDAQDAMQTAFVQAFREISRFRGEGSLRNWLFRIALNAALRIARRRRDALELVEETAEVEDDAPGVVERLAVRTALARRLDLGTELTDALDYEPALDDVART